MQVGDKVWAYNYETGETELKEVLNVWVKETDELIHVTISDGETIDTTSNHPFWVEGKGWVAAGDLDVGDELTTADGGRIEITDIEIEKLAEPVAVYNLEVDNLHTYFVSPKCVLVHNMYEYEVDRYSRFNRKSQKGDGIDGHEILKNSWLKLKGYITKRENGMSRRNPSIGLTEEFHKIITQAQRELGLFDLNDLANLSAYDVITENLNLLREHNVPTEAIEELESMLTYFLYANNIT